MGEELHGRGQEAGQHRDEIGTSHIRPRCMWLWIRVEWEGRNPWATPSLVGVGGGRRVWAAAADPPSCAGSRGWAPESEGWS